MSSGAAEGAAEWPRPPRETPWALAAGVAFGVVQPVLDLVGRSPEFLVAHRGGRLDLALLAAAALLLPALGVGIGWLLVRLAPSLGGPVVAVLLSLAGCAVGWQAQRVLRLPEGIWWAVPLLAAGAVWVWFRAKPLRAFVSLLLPAPLVFVAAFLLQGDVRRAVAPAGTAGGAVAIARTPIFLLVFDEWSFVSVLGVDGDLDALRYPNLARFASGATWFRNASSVSETTGKAMASIVTGLMPELRQLPTATDHPRSLFSMLAPPYRVRAYEPITRLCPDSLNEVDPRSAADRLAELGADLRVVWLHQVSPPPLAATLPEITHAWAGFAGGNGDSAALDLAQASWQFLEDAIAGVTGGARSESFLRFVDDIDAEPGAIYFHHSLLPHRPWEYLEHGRRYVPEPTDGITNEVWTGTPAQVEVAYARYEAQVAFVDSLLGRFFERLRELGLYDRALIVVLGDHGVSFRRGTPRREFVPENAVELAAIPLFLKAPGQTEARVVEEVVTTLDVLPTMLDALDVEAPWPLDGRSALGAAPPSYPAGLPFLVASPTRGPHRGLVRLNPDLHQAKYGTLEWKRSFLVVGSDGVPRFHPGPRRDLIGRALSELEVLSAGEPEIRFGASSAPPAELPGESGSSFVRGALLGVRDRLQQELAISSNGRIVATAQAGGGAGVLAFSALVPPPAAPRHGEFEWLLIQERGGTTVLQRLRAPE